MGPDSTMSYNVELKGFDEFDKYAQTIDSTGPPVFFYFSGSKSPDGSSWCPDCNDAEPVVKNFLSQLKKDITFVYVDVGDMAFWKDRACPFRTDGRSKLMVIPTIIKWGGVQRLEGSQCNKRDLLDMLLEEEEN